ncbi:MAG: hypothetical protein U5R31_09375 [Acidimicrobiia bacterium]|nr:hypothetical protein [Acidimicrobiia bacterium]
MSVGTLVRRVGFRRLLVGQGVSSLGDWMATVAFMALALICSGIVVLANLLAVRGTSEPSGRFPTGGTAT